MNSTSRTVKDVNFLDLLFRPPAARWVESSPGSEFRRGRFTLNYVTTSAIQWESRAVADDAASTGTFNYTWVSSAWCRRQPWLTIILLTPALQPSVVKNSRLLQLEICKKQKGHGTCRRLNCCMYRPIHQASNVCFHDTIQYTAGHRW